MVNRRDVQLQPDLETVGQVSIGQKLFCNQRALQRMLFLVSKNDFFSLKLENAHSEIKKNSLL